MSDRVETVRLRTRPWRREAVPFDALEWAEEPRRVRLDGGQECSVPVADQAAVRRALAAVQPTGALHEDLAAFVAYTEGAWSPVRAAHALVTLGASGQASDIHVEAGPEGAQVRMRLHGTLTDLVLLAPAVGTRLVAALKHVSGCLPYRTDIVQEGRIARAGVAADARTSFLPTAFGERVAIRLFGRLRSIEELGLPSGVDASLRRLLRARSGLVLVAGPSGGGKTTTVYASLRALATERPGAHVSIEDPVEQRLRLAGIPVDQVELDPARGLTAAAALQGVLRQDIDVVALSEVRTSAEAGLALEAAHTGRLVVAGLHAGSAAEARQRMLDLGADALVLDQTLRGVLHQALRSAPCPNHRATRCPTCADTGRVMRPAASIWEAP